MRRWPSKRKTNLDGIDLEVEILVLYEAVDALREHGLEIALTGPPASVGGHHARDGGVGAEEGSKFGCGLELSGEDGLEHGEEEMFLSTLVLVAVEGEHDGLEEGIDFGQADETTEGSDMAGFGLEKEEEVGVLL